MRPFATALTILVVAGMLAGCVSGKPKEALSPTPSDPNALPDGVRDVLQGIVTSNDKSPIQGVNLTISLANQTRTTDASGKYRFEDLDPRDYIVVAQKDGYITKQLRAILEEGKISQLDIQMEEKSRLAPYSQNESWTGQLACKFAYSSDPENYQEMECPGADPLGLNSKSSKVFTIDAHAAQVIVEARWVSKSKAADYLQMSIETVGLASQDISFGKQSGKTGLKMPVGSSLLSKNLPDGGKLRVSMSAHPSMTEQDVDVGAAFQQDFELAFTVFYLEPGPTNYSYFPK